MPRVDTSDLPKKGDQLRILLTSGRWLYAEVTQISPSMSFINTKVLGIKEVEDEVSEPSTLKDEKDPMGATNPVAPVDSSTPGRKRSRPSRDPGLPPSPVLEVEHPGAAQSDDGMLF